MSYGIDILDNAVRNVHVDDNRRIHDTKGLKRGKDPSFFRVYV